MSGERNVPRPRPAPYEASHVASQPFPIADDYQERIRPMVTLESMHRDMIDGFAAVHTDITALATRVTAIEADAAWKQRAIRVGKALVPFVLGILTQYAPGVASHLGGLLQAIGGAQ